MQHVLGAGTPLRLGMPLAELPFSTDDDANHALSIFDATIRAVPLSPSDATRSAFSPRGQRAHERRAVPVPAGSLRMRLRLSSGTS